MALSADSSAETDTGGSFGILFVCTGNVCRSAFAERLAGAWFTDAGTAGVTVSSAGTRALVGEPMHGRSASLLRWSFGVEADGFTARQLAGQPVAQADLVLTAERSHRAATVSLYPRAARYAFTLREFGRLVQLVDVGQAAGEGGRARARSLVAQAASVRGQLPPRPPHLDGVPDPYGADDRAHDAALQLIAEVLAEPLTLLARALAGAGRVP